MNRTKIVYEQDGVNWPPTWHLIESGRTLCGSCLTGAVIAHPGDVIITPRGEARVVSVLFPMEPSDLFFATLQG